MVSNLPIKLKLLWLLIELIFWILLFFDLDVLIEKLNSPIPMKLYLTVFFNEYCVGPSSYFADS